MATTKTPAPPVHEQGYADEYAGSSQAWWVSTQREKTPELRWPQCLDVFDDMDSQDAQVSSVLRAVIMPILRTRWAIDGTGCRPQVTAHVARDFGLPVVGEEASPILRRRGRFSWPEHLAVALEDKLKFGHAVFEQAYAFDEIEELFHLAKLGYRPPRTIQKFEVARDGGLVAVVQKGLPGEAPIELLVEWLVVYVRGKKGGNWIGRSLLRPAYKNWLLKDRLLRVQTQSVERNGMGVPLYKGAPGEKNLEAGRDIATSIRSGDNAGAAIPNEADIELLGVTGTLPNADIPIRYHDEQIARTVLAHFLNLGTQTGSWALGSTFADFFTLGLQSEAAEICETANQHIVEDLVDVNWGPDEPAPRLVFDEIGSNREAIVQAISVLVTANVLHPDEELEQFVRTSLGLPPRETDPTAPTPQEAP
ncbi:MAG TPA: DUF935 family protein [Marmoricola sp.]|jgi:phage gp29-like protein|nr:DUF935 family protein [Marmoricola sp.]